MKEHTPSKKPMYYYAVIAMIAIMLLNAFVFPELLQNEVKEVGYNEFLQMVDAGKVTEVSRGLGRSNALLQNRHLAG